MVLSGDKIHKRLKQGQIFRKDTWCEHHLKEASYALRLAEDGLLVDGEFYSPGSKSFRREYVDIDPGKIAILSTMEEFDMPCDLMGKVGIRIDHALLGLTGLMGIQVDPLYGSDHVGERLYIRVVNLGNEAIRLTVGEEVFTFELHRVEGKFMPRAKARTWDRLKDRLRYQDEVSWTYATRIENELGAETQNLKDYHLPVVLFGVFLVAATILGVAISIALSFQAADDRYVPSWFHDWGWVLLLGIFGFATLITGLIGLFTAFQFAKKTSWNIKISFESFRKWKERSDD